MVLVSAVETGVSCLHDYRAGHSESLNMIFVIVCGVKLRKFDRKIPLTFVHYYETN